MKKIFCGISKFTKRLKPEFCIHLQSNRESKQNISRLPEKYLLGKMIKKRVLHPRFE